MKCLFIYHKQLVINIIAGTSSHLSSVNNRNSEYGLQMPPPSHMQPSFIAFVHPTNSYFSPPPTPAPVRRILVISLCEMKKVENRWSRLVSTLPGHG